MRQQRLLAVEEASGVGEAERHAAAVSREAGFGETVTGHVSIVARELATNLVKHGAGGLLVVRLLEPPEPPGIELLALDRGPGIRNIGESMRDGQSTAGSRGEGLGAVRRLSSVFEIYAPPGAGTAVLSRIWAQTPNASLAGRSLAVGAVNLPLKGEAVCGDAWAVHQTGERLLVLVADGLGHGPDAADAADQAVRAFHGHAERGPAALVGLLDAALRPTRGAAVAVAEVLPRHGVVTYAGLGNITGRIYDGEAVRNLATSDGTAGTGTRMTHEYTYAWPSDGMLVMHSDGLTARWDLHRYSGLRGRHPALVAGVLLRDHRRERDDATIVAVTLGPGAP